MPSVSYTTSGWFIFTVPAGVPSVVIDLRGAGGGGSDGGRGGRVTGSIATVGGQKLYCFIGANGISGGTGDRGGGGGGGGDGHFEANGSSGGGASQIRLSAITGTLKAAAGGGGGQSGDGGDGGDGGAATGQSGSRGSSGGNSTSNATGGTTTQGGNGGTSSSGGQFNGQNASDAQMGGAGNGGSANSGVRCHGGGGGGGGFHAGGGGQAASSGFAPGGGGGGGSNYTGGVIGAVSTRGAGAAAGGVGSLTITYGTPPPANIVPIPPTNVKLNGVDVTEDMSTRAVGSVVVSATVDDFDSTDLVQLYTPYSTSPSFSSYTPVFSTLGAQNITRSTTLTGLLPNTHYYVRAYTRDSKGAYSAGYKAFDFWTNRNSTPVNFAPNENVSLPANSTITFKWDFIDPDPGDTQSAFRLSYRRLVAGQPGPWTLIEQIPYTVGCGLPDPANRFCWSVDPGTFIGNSFYEWKVQTRDAQNLWGDESQLFSFFATSASSPPDLLSPVDGEAVNVSVEKTFTWRFIDPDPGDVQTKADLRYRVVGTEDWIAHLGAIGPGVPGADPFWTFSPDTFAPGYHYEWQARTYDTIGGLQSGWSESEDFWTTLAPGSAVNTTPSVPVPEVQGSLGCGTYRTFIYAQGGKTLIGEIDPIASLTFTRVRDDISSANIKTNGFGSDCCELLGNLRTWMHELVIFRDNVRVWEGPITRLEYTTTEVEIEAKDCMAYLYRRIMRQGYNDAHRIVDDQEVGLSTVTRRAQQIILNALAPYDPNLIPFLTCIEFEDDARQSRVVADYSKTAWEEVDDLAATAGLDYTTVGRRIILWDTHNAIGKLPEMRDGDFSNPPVVSEYGMQLANYFAVTNGSGVFGDAERSFPDFYGPVEQLASAYGEAEGGTEDTLTAQDRENLVIKLSEQAERNIAGRWPGPVIVRVPDNSTLNPKIGIGFDQLVPGVHIPLRATGTCRNVAQWQKLDSVAVVYDDKGEKVNVVMSPAPRNREDDSDSEGEVE